MSEHMPMVMAAARALNQRVADSCGIDAEDQWKLYANEMLEDAQAMLDAAGAPELLEALSEADEALELEGLRHDGPTRSMIRAAIAKARGEA